MVVFRVFAVAALLFGCGAARADFAAGLAAYERGDFEAAYREWLPLAEAGDAEAQFRVGRLYDVGEGQPRNGRKAVAWYEKAYAHGHVKAAYNLAYLYHKGVLIPQDYEKARKIYTYGAMRNHGSSQLHLGFIYIGGFGVTKNATEAYKWFFLAADNGSKNANRAIVEFEKFSTRRERLAGKRKYREWQMNHSR